MDEDHTNLEAEALAIVKAILGSDVSYFQDCRLLYSMLIAV
jgi:hypothetical protein